MFHKQIKPKISMQQLQIIGNLGEDCQIKDVNGKRFAAFRVACTEKMRKGGDDAERTQWYSCTLNNPESPVIPFLKKGTRVFVQGLPLFDLYDSVVHRCKMIDAKIFVDRIQLCSDRKAEDQPDQLEDDTAPF